MSQQPLPTAKATAAQEVSTGSPAVRFVLWGVLVLALAGAFFAWALTWRTGVMAGPLPVLQGVPDFSLTERSGKVITKNDLLGKVWLADFVFTRCSGPCPQLSARFQRLQKIFDQPGFQLVTFSLDPLVDTSVVLSDYAKRFHADESRWWFLTTDKESTMHDLVRGGFFQTVIPSTDGKELIHSEYLVLVDRKGHIRAAYLGTDLDNQPQLIADVRKLLSEPGA